MLSRTRPRKRPITSLAVEAAVLAVAVAHRAVVVLTKTISHRRMLRARVASPTKARQQRLRLAAVQSHQPIQRPLPVARQHRPLTQRQRVGQPHRPQRLHCAVLQRQRQNRRRKSIRTKVILAQKATSHCLTKLVVKCHQRNRHKNRHRRLHAGPLQRLLPLQHAPLLLARQRVHHGLPQRLPAQQRPRPPVRPHRVVVRWPRSPSTNTKTFPRKAATRHRLNRSLILPMTRALPKNRQPLITPVAVNSVPPFAERSLR
jgi:hypothetical protein